MKLHQFEFKSLGRRVKPSEVSLHQGMSCKLWELSLVESICHVLMLMVLTREAGWTGLRPPTQKEESAEGPWAYTHSPLFRVSSVPSYLPGTPQPSQSQRGVKALAFWPGHNLQFSPQRGSGSRYSVSQRRFFFSGLLPNLLAPRQPVASLHPLQPVPN